MKRKVLVNTDELRHLKIAIIIITVSSGKSWFNRPFAQWHPPTATTTTTTTKTKVTGKISHAIFIRKHINNNNNNNNNKSFIYTGDIYQHYTMLVFTKCPVNKIYNNVVLNFFSKTLKTAAATSTSASMRTSASASTTTTTTTTTNIFTTTTTATTTTTILLPPAESFSVLLSCAN